MIALQKKLFGNILKYFVIKNQGEGNLQLRTKNIAANFIRDEFIKSDLTGSAKGIDNYFQKLH
jgi:hypothetical protein